MSKRMFRLGAVTLVVLGVALMVPATPRSTSPLLIGGLLVVGGSVLAWRQARDGQIIDRYRQAVEHLGSDLAEVRAGGLRELEQIAKDSARSRLLVDVTLGDFLRERSPWTDAEHPVRLAGEGPAPDVATALAILTGLPGAALDLSEVDLRGADLGKRELGGAVIRHANLAGARLTGTRLDDSVLAATDLRDADLRGASLRRASLRVARLEGADLRAADLTDADLRGADMRAVNLDKAVLTGARVNRGTLWPPDFTPARVSASLFSD
ncbi:pentapeptide repeat-containing protein [Lentzea sp. CC55]|uniref:pentapeptide repeat-containing protein n=1 Tax=Lentzea sp. CC55 TaxID=2884909 RepID=UPI0027E16995|nr:pentapeptide repeat-containing protein [Lentzea sp. CC55]MCG8924447.1 pentapeptide repeat-containing protein [Lentzea sp. CC55]